jgi:hypothetical protein
MQEMTLQDLANKVADIDFSMLSTRAAGGEIAARPMSNNGDVEYDGDSWFFTSEDAAMVKEIEQEPRIVCLCKANPGFWASRPSSSPSKLRRNSSATKPPSNRTGHRASIVGFRKALTLPASSSSKLTQSALSIGMAKKRVKSRSNCAPTNRLHSGGSVLQCGGIVTWRGLCLRMRP